MKKRLEYYQADPKTIDALSAVSRALAGTFADPKLKALLELRVSQINGCAYCVNLHSIEARQRGERQQRLDCLPVWREVEFFDARERAALDWAESVTLIAGGSVSDELFRTLREHFSDTEIVQLTAIVGLMNVWNRLSISFRNTPAAVASAT
jgi:AhpD family alkylhydroperoxidase